MNSGGNLRSNETRRLPQTYMPVSSYAGEIKTIFLMNFLQDEKEIQVILARYENLINELRWSNSDVKVFVLVAHDVATSSMMDDGNDAFMDEIKRIFGNNLAGYNALVFNPGGNANKNDARQVAPEMIEQVSGLNISAQYDVTTDPTLPDTDTPDFSIFGGLDPFRFLFPSGHVGQSSRELGYTTGSIFAQDPFVAIERGPDSIVLLNSVYSDHSLTYRLVADALASQLTNLEILVKPTGFLLQGGNILKGDDFMIIGRDILERNKKEFRIYKDDREGEKALDAAMAAFFGVQDIFWAGTRKEMPMTRNVEQGRYQPLFHVDMFITLGGKISNDEFLIFVGKIVMPEKSDSHVVNDLVKTMRKRLNKIAEKLEEKHLGGHRIKVVRIPLVFDAVYNKFLSFNNCLVEIYGDTKNVFLPDYQGNDEDGDGILDDAAGPPKNMRKYARDTQKKFEKYGFKVRWVKGDYLALSREMNGSLHCICKVLERG